MPHPFRALCGKGGRPCLIGYSYVNQLRCGQLFEVSALDQLDIQAKRLQLADQSTLKLSGTPGSDGRFALDDGFVSIFVRP